MAQAMIQQRLRKMKFRGGAGNQIMNSSWHFHIPKDCGWDKGMICNVEKLTSEKTCVVLRFTTEKDILGEIIFNRSRNISFGAKLMGFVKITIDVENILFIPKPWVEKFTSIFKSPLMGKTEVLGEMDFKRKYKTSREVYKQVLEAESREGALQIIREQKPEDLVYKRTCIEKHLDNQFPPEMEQTYELKDFKVKRISPEELKQGTIVFSGPTCTGKTTWAFAHFRNPLSCRHIDEIKRLDSTLHDGIIFNDFDCSSLHPGDIMSLVEINEDVQLSTRYKCARINRGTPRIFTTNKNVDALFQKEKFKEPAEWNALLSRVILIEIMEPLFDGPAGRASNCTISGELSQANSEMLWKGAPIRKGSAARESVRRKSVQGGPTPPIAPKKMSIRGKSVQGGPPPSIAPKKLSIGGKSVQGGPPPSIAPKKLSIGGKSVQGGPPPSNAPKQLSIVGQSVQSAGPSIAAKPRKRSVKVNIVTESATPKRSKRIYERAKNEELSSMFDDMFQKYGQKG